MYSRCMCEGWCTWVGRSQPGHVGHQQGCFGLPLPTRRHQGVGLWHAAGFSVQWGASHTWHLYDDEGWAGLASGAVCEAGAPLTFRDTALKRRRCSTALALVYFLHACTAASISAALRGSSGCTGSTVMAEACCRDAGN